MSDAFISYSHHDRDFAVRLQRALRDSGKEIWVDESDIRSGARWAEELKSAIEDADSFVFVISPDSVASTECKQELSYAAELNKRIIPLNLRVTPLAVLPEAIRAVQFVPPRGLFENDPDPTSENTFENSLALLITTIDTDLDATREHTEWGKKALEWDKHTRDRSFLLTGSELEAAEQWLVRRTGKGPEPTDLQKSYVLTSRQGATRRQRRLLSGVTIALVVALVLGGLALLQRDHAIAEAHVALSGELAAESTNLLTSNVGLGTLLSLEAFAVSPTVTARDALVEAVEQPLSAILRDANPVNSVAFSPDGKMLAAGGDDGNVVLWDTVSDSETGRLVGQPLSAVARVDLRVNSVNSVAFSPDGKTLAVGDDNGNVVLWNTVSRSEIGRLVGQPISIRGSAINSPVESVAFSPDGKTLAAGTDDGGVVLWDTASRSEIGQLGEELSSSNPIANLISSVAFSPDGKTLAAGSEIGVELWNTVSRSQIGQPLGYNVQYSYINSVAFSPDGKTLAAGGVAGNVVLWDTATGSQIRQLVSPGGGFVKSVAFSPDGKTLAASDKAGKVTLWDTTTGSQIGQPLGGDGGNAVNSVAFSPDGKTLAAGDDAGNVVLWNTIIDSDMGQILSRNYMASVYSVAFNPDGKTLAVGDGDGNVVLWHTASRSEIGLLGGAIGDSVDSVAYSPDSKTLVAGMDEGSVVLWDTASRSEIGRLVGQPGLSVGAIHSFNSVRSVAFSPDGKTLAVGDDNGNVVLWDTTSRSEIGRLVGPGGGGAINSAGYLGQVSSVAFSPDGKTLAAGDLAGRVALWDSASHSKLNLNLNDGDSDVESVAFSPDGKMLAVGESNGNVVLCNTVSRSEIGQPLGDGDGSVVKSVAFSPDGKTLAAGDNDGNVVLWDTASDSKLNLTLNDGDDSGIASVAFSPDNATLAVGDDNGNVALYQSLYWADNYGAVTHDLCSKVRGNLTPDQWSQYVPGLAYQRVC